MKRQYWIMVAALIGGCSDGSNLLVEPSIEKLGEACAAHEDCGGLRCDAGVCAVKLDAGASCQDDEDCQSGTCSGKVCAAGDACDSGDCSDDKGDDKGDAKGSTCMTSETCAKGLVCYSGLCSRPVLLGERCDAAFTHCAEGLCQSGKCELTEDLKDTDGDTIPDSMDRCDEDTDGDTIPNCKDLDSDGDTIPDAVEAANGGNLAVAPMDTDGDTLPDFLSLDSDGNGIPDAFEGCPSADFPYTGEDAAQPTAVCDNPVDTDGDTVPDYRSHDNDGDGASDISEITGIFNRNNEPGQLCGGVVCAPGTAVNPWDTDGDTIPDYMSPDSDGDTIPDDIELFNDSNGDGVLDRYSLDSDGDTLPDGQEVDANGKPLYYVSSGGGVVYCFQTQDCDNDGVLDANELVCNGVSAMVTPDVDGDGYDDASELVAGQYAVTHGLLNGKKIDSAEALVCDPTLGVKDVFDFYFELPYQGDKKNDTLEFIPKVSKLDVVFNVDTTASMNNAINSVKTNVRAIINSVRGNVTDSGFTLSMFDDFPVGNYGKGRDLPFRVLGQVETDPNKVAAYTSNALFTTRDGYDVPESGAESLYQIVTKAGVSWAGGSVTFPSMDADRWGGAGFRKDTLPVIIHVSDQPSHDRSSSLYKTSGDDSYNSSVYSPHYTDDLVPKLKSTGARVISLNVGSQRGDDYQQMTAWSRESNAVIPVCAFKTQTGWSCGENKCCLGTVASSAVDVGEKSGQCILKYTGAQDSVATYISQGVGALVKYGTYEVATRIEGEPIPGSSVTTACFIKQVVATQYLPPPQEPEQSCNPVAVPTRVNGADYNNGFANFAPGTASNGVEGARLHFTVIAQNDNCVPASQEAQIFRAYIDVINPTTGLSFGRRQVSIIVPPATQVIVN